LKIFDVGNMKIIAGPNGLKKDEELTFFYPSTEYSMVSNILESRGSEFEP